MKCVTDIKIATEVAMTGKVCSILYVPVAILCIILQPYITTPKRLEGISQSTSSLPDQVSSVMCVCVRTVHVYYNVPSLLQVDENTSSLLCLPIFSKDRQTIGRLCVTGYSLYSLVHM